jgi:hypothetical protein
VSRRPSGSEESRHPLLVQIGQLQTLSHRPQAKLAQVLQHVPDRLERVAPPQQPSPVALDLRPQQTSFPARTRHRTRLPRGSSVLPPGGCSQRVTMPRVEALNSLPTKSQLHALGIVAVSA